MKTFCRDCGQEITRDQQLDGECYVDWNERPTGHVKCAEDQAEVES